MHPSKLTMHRCNQPTDDQPPDIISAEGIDGEYKGFESMSRCRLRFRSESLSCDASYLGEREINFAVALF